MIVYVWAWIKLKPLKLWFSAERYVPTHVESQDFRGFLHLDRTGRVRNEPKFGVATKETECAFRGQRENFLQVSQEQSK